MLLQLKTPPADRNQYVSILNELLECVSRKNKNDFVACCLKSFTSYEEFSKFIQSFQEKDFALTTEEAQTEYTLYLVYLTRLKVLHFPEPVDEHAVHPRRPEITRESLVYTDFNGHRYPHWPHSSFF